MRGNNFDKHQKWTILLSIGAMIISIGVGVISYFALDNMRQQYELLKRQHDESQKEKEIYDKIAIAATIFRRASSEQDFDKAFHMFLDIYRIKPADSTGHDLFYDRATTCADKQLAKKLMEQAIQLKPK